MVSKQIKVVGIDLAGSAKRPTGISYLRGDEVVDSKIVYEDDEILRFVEKNKPKVIAIDAPLSLPPGRKLTAEGGFPPDNKVHLRPCDEELRRRGIRFFPVTLGPMRSLTIRGIALKERLEALGYRAIEIYPGGAQDVWGIARKQQGLSLLRGGLRRKLRVRGLSVEMSDHELDAVSGAIVGRLFLEGRAEIYGDFESGAIVMPAMNQRVSRRVSG